MDSLRCRTDFAGLGPQLTYQPEEEPKRRHNGSKRCGNSQHALRASGAQTRLAPPKTIHKKIWLILGCLRDWLWKLFGKAMKAFFDALLDHYGGR